SPAWRWTKASSLSTRRSPARCPPAAQPSTPPARSIILHRTSHPTRAARTSSVSIRRRHGARLRASFPGCARERPPARSSPATRADITREQVAAAGGTTLANLLKNPDREIAAPVMAEGATKLVVDLHARGQIHGVIGLGGTQGTTLCTKVMRALPYGVPKI